MSTTSILPQRDIVRNNDTGDYALYLDGELVGYAQSRYEGEDTLDEIAYARLIARPLTETEALAHELVANYFGLDLTDALEIAAAKIDKVLSYAADYDAWVNAQTMQEAA